LFSFVKNSVKYNTFNSFDILSNVVNNNNCFAALCPGREYSGEPVPEDTFTHPPT